MFSIIWYVNSYLSLDGFSSCQLDAAKVNFVSSGLPFRGLTVNVPPDGGWLSLHIVSKVSVQPPDLYHPLLQWVHKVKTEFWVPEQPPDRYCPEEGTKQSLQTESFVPKHSPERYSSGLHMEQALQIVFWLSKHPPDFYCPDGHGEQALHILSWIPSWQPPDWYCPEGHMSRQSLHTESFSPEQPPERYSPELHKEHELQIVFRSYKHHLDWYSPCRHSKQSLHIES